MGRVGHKQANMLVHNDVGWVGWGGVGGDVTTSVETFTHGRYYMFSRVRRACCGVGWVGGWVGM